MHTSIKTFTRQMLSALLLAMFVLSPNVFAKKDLFANDPSEKPENQTQQLVTPANTSEQINNEKAISPEATIDKKNDSEESKSSYMGQQLERLKLNMIETKNDLFGKKEKSKQEIKKSQSQTEQVQTAHSEYTSSNEAPAITPTLSSSEAAQKAQLEAQGQVMNVRLYQDEEKMLYAVKVLQKNGRMKTVNLDANSGEIIEDKPQ